MTTPLLLERDAETAALRRAVEDATAGRGGVVLLEGPAGIGKTALLDAVVPIAREHDARVLGARASELDRGFAFGVVHQLLEPALGALDDDGRARAFAGGAARATALFSDAAPAAADPEYGVLSGLYWLVANLAEDRPVVLRVDDLHWSDVASVRFLEFLGRRVDDLPVLVVGTLRPNEPGAPTAMLLELAGGPATRTLRPEPLGGGAVGAVLASELGGEPDPAFADAARETTGGNPLLVATLARESAAAGFAGRAAEADRLGSLGAGVAPTVARRLAVLGPDAPLVARAAAVAGERAPIDDLAQLADLPVDRVRPALHALIDAAVLSPGGWSFVHPLVRAAVTAATPHGELARLHGQAARRLRDRGARPTEVASHWLAADPSGSAEAVADLRDAARIAAAEGATETAVELLRRALDEPPAPADRPGVIVDLGELELRAQLPEGAARLRAALADGLPDDQAVRARAALAFVLVHTEPQVAFSEAERARAATDDEALRLRLEALVLEALTFVDAFGPERDARMAAGRAGDASPVMLAFLALQASSAGRPPAETLDLSRRALSDGSLMAAVGPGGSTWNLLTHAHRFAEDAEGCRRMLVDGEAEIRRAGLHVASLFVNQSWGYWHRDFGSVATGAARAQLGLDAVRELGLDVTIPALAAITAENLVLLDRLDDAAATVDVPLGASEGTFIEPFVRSSRGLVRALLRRTAEAEEDFRRTIDAADARGWTSPFATRARLRLAELLAARGDREEALALADHDVAAARAAGTAGALGASLRVRSLALEGDDVVDGLREAVAVLEPGPMGLETAWALHDLGGALRRRGHREEARDVLRRALDLASRAEAAWVGRLVRAELEAAGARPRRERTSGAEALTPSERRVAELAAEGLSNREIAEALWVTRKTVEHHLGHTYGKLGIRSRTGLAAALGGTPANA